MKIYTSQQIKEIDKYTIENEPIPSIDLMERAATAFYNCFIALIKKDDKIVIFAGTGNNGGDALAIARMLLNNEYDVKVFIVNFSDKYTNDFSINKERLININKDIVYEINKNTELPYLNDYDIIIDGIFGTGLTRPVIDFPAELIRHINNSKRQVVSIDMPSGLFSEDNSNNGKNIIKADYIITFEFPKLSFFLSDNIDYVGEWISVAIGLNKTIKDITKTPYNLIDENIIRTILPIRKKFSHKGNYGHSLIIAGSYGKIGAAVLSSKACIKAGTGLVTLYIPRCGYNIVQTSVPEAMVITSENEDYISNNIDTTIYSAIGIGPGIGTNKQTANILKLIIQNYHYPIVFDADAINILAENKTWLPFLPQNSILTPHPKEFERLVGKASNHYKRIELQKEFSVKNNIYIILKGAYTSISCPDGTIFFNPTGNPGMATGGSGDVLTGILTSLLAQGYKPLHASLVGVYIHGLAGDIAAKKHSQEAMSASNIIDYIGKTFKKIKQIN